MRSHPLIFVLVTILIALLLTQAMPGRAQAGNAYDLINAVNALRAANGLAPLNVDPILMAIAQAHSDYQASIGQVTHTGQGGTRPRDRAAAAGYGGGATFFISENILGGGGFSPQEAVNAWTNDDLHWSTMMGATYLDIGAGATTNGNTVYYTIDVAYVAGAVRSGTTTPTVVVSGTVVGPTPIPVNAVLTATPSADGAVIHTVQFGHTLYGIAEAYGISIDELLALNNRNINDRLYVGDRLIIHPAATATVTPNITDTPTPMPPTATRRPTRTATLPRPTKTASPTITITSTATPLPALGSDPVGTVMLGGIIVLVLLGGGFVIAGVILKKQKPVEPGGPG